MGYGSSVLELRVRWRDIAEELEITGGEGWCEDVWSRQPGYGEMERLEQLNLCTTNMDWSKENLRQTDDPFHPTSSLLQHHPHPIHPLTLPSCRQTPRCQGEICQKGRSQGNPIPLCPKGPNLRLVPPTQHSPTRPSSSIPSKIGPSFTSNGSIQDDSTPFEH